MKQLRTQLVNVIIGKSIVETIFVGVLAVAVYVNAFPPTFHGWGEWRGETRSIAGWAVNNASPWERVEVQLFIDGTFRSTQLAQLSRPDVATAGWAKDEWHGYKFMLADLAPGTHEARVYALHHSKDQMTLQLLGDPIRFTWTQR